MASLAAFTFETFHLECLQFLDFLCPVGLLVPKSMARWMRRSDPSVFRLSDFPFYLHFQRKCTKYMKVILFPLKRTFGCFHQIKEFFNVFCFYSFCSHWDSLVSTFILKKSFKTKFIFRLVNFTKRTFNDYFLMGKKKFSLSKHYTFLELNFLVFQSNGSLKTVIMFQFYRYFKRQLRSLQRLLISFFTWRFKKNIFDFLYFERKMF